jgi:hypothetical protein
MSKTTSSSNSGDTTTKISQNYGNITDNSGDGGGSGGGSGNGSGLGGGNGSRSSGGGGGSKPSKPTKARVHTYTFADEWEMPLQLHGSAFHDFVDCCLSKDVAVGDASRVTKCLLMSCRVVMSCRVAHSNVCSHAHLTIVLQFAVTDASDGCGVVTAPLHRRKCDVERGD